MPGLNGPKSKITVTDGLKNPKICTSGAGGLRPYFVHANSKGSDAAHMRRLA